ncbi:response regulator transcription factor [bacterium]|nr:response regulator transcription factor [bacterium]
MAKILVVDDDAAINELIKVNLELAYYKVITALDGNKGFALAKQELPNLIILDVMMPEVDGYTVAKWVRENETTKDIPILMLTALGMLQNKVQGFNIGVDDYLVKPFEMEELLVRVKALLKRTNNIPKSVAIKEVLTKGDITLIPETYSIEIKGKQAKITPIEFDIVNLLMQNYGNMVSSAKILNDVWGYSADDAVETIRVHMRHLRAKLDKISDGKKYIETIYGGGYRLVPEGIVEKAK